MNTTWDVMYSVFTGNINEGDWSSSGPGHYTTRVVAFNQPQAEMMVVMMNGGPNHCLIRSCFPVR